MKSADTKPISLEVSLAVPSQKEIVLEDSPTFVQLK